MSADPVVSVSITTYQHVNFIRQCLDSVLMQETNFPFEILLGEDDSSDGTREICQEYAGKHPDLIRLFLHGRKDNLVINGRPTGRLNLVNNLRQARGRYIALLDGDDYWTDPTKLQRQFEALEADPEAAGCFHGFSVVDVADGSTRNGFVPKSSERYIDLQALIHRKKMATGSMFFRNVVDWRRLPNWFFSVPVGDYGLALLVAQVGDWYFMPDVMSAYRRHTGGRWSRLDLMDRSDGDLGLFEALLSDPAFKPVEQEILKKLGLIRWAKAVGKGERGNIGGCIVDAFFCFFDRNSRPGAWQMRRLGKAVLGGMAARFTAK